ncbi:MAG TPA: hypothetical protein VF603_08675 [Allosphingosinicella sp.]|jgi:hypothetical protein
MFGTRPQAAGDGLAHVPRVLIEDLAFLIGAWEGERAEGGRLYVEFAQPQPGTILVSYGSGPGAVVPIFRIEERDGRIIATDAFPPAASSNLRLTWTVRRYAPNLVVFSGASRIGWHRRDADTLVQIDRRSDGRRFRREETVLTRFEGRRRSPPSAAPTRRRR